MHATHLMSDSSTVDLHLRDANKRDSTMDNKSTACTQMQEAATPTVVAVLHQHHQGIQPPGILKDNWLLGDAQRRLIAQKDNDIARVHLPNRTHQKCQQSSNTTLKC